MAFKVGTCTGHYELLEIIRRFSKGNGIVGQSTYSGTGNGTMSGEDLDPLGTNETWTISCIDIAVTGSELWSVTGSVTGSLGQYTTGDTYAETRIGFKITAGATPFAIADAFTVVGSSFVGTGNGTIDGIDLAPAAITETWTIACTDATTAGAEVWSVTGSVSGAQASATTGVAYSNEFITAFTITAGGTNFAVSDQFTFNAHISDLSNVNQAWVEERYVDDVLDAEGLPDLELILRGPGLSGTEQIWASFTTNQSINSDYYNFSVGSMVGYVDQNALSDQPSYSGQRWAPCWGQSIRYWLVVNGQRIHLAMKVETNYITLGTGKYFPYATPGQFPYPIYVMATSASSTTRYSGTYNIDLFSSQVKLRKFDGVWSSAYVWPVTTPLTASFNGPGGLKTTDGVIEESRDLNGDYPLAPLSLYINTSTEGMKGDLDGVFHVSGFNSAVENIVTSGLVSHVKIANRQATGIQSYYALRLE